MSNLFDVQYSEHVNLNDCELLSSFHSAFGLAVILKVQCFRCQLRVHQAKPLVSVTHCISYARDLTLFMGHSELFLIIEWKSGMLIRACREIDAIASQSLR